jgi:ubiquinone/menaquinone biosynthesis C-methylase UbiE
MGKGFNTISYDAHKEHYKYSSDVLSRLKNKGSVDYWRHERIYNLLKPFLLEKEALWLTVGDGLGTDSNWLLGKGVGVVASDISEYGLKAAKEQGFINNYRVENAEDLTFKDNEVDYVLCKEAFHHFPRPYIAVYEMLRVASRGVVLIEPVDIGIQFPFLIYLKNILDKFSTSLINKIWKNRFSFETVGNYVFKLSEREVEKIAMGLNLSHVAFKGINDYYTKKIDLNAPVEDKKVLRKVKRKIILKNVFSKLGLTPYELHSCVIFKQPPSEITLQQLSNEGYKIVELPENPYLLK